MPIAKRHEKIIFKLLSSDEINDNLTEEYMQENPGVCKKVAFAKTRPQYKRAYNFAIRNLFRDIYQESLEKCQNGLESGSSLIFMVYVDKNHPLNKSSQAPVHGKFRAFAKNDELKFISVNLIGKEILSEDSGIVRQNLETTKYYLCYIIFLIFIITFIIYYFILNKFYIIL